MTGCIPNFLELVFGILIFVLIRMILHDKQRSVPEPDLAAALLPHTLIANLRYAFFNLCYNVMRRTVNTFRRSDNLLYLRRIRRNAQGIVEDSILDHVLVVYDVAEGFSS